MNISVDSFKENILPKLRNNYIVTFLGFSGGDLGSLERVEIESEKFLGAIEFWSFGWLGIHLVNIQTDQEILNFLISPSELTEQINRLEEFEKILIEHL